MRPPQRGQESPAFHALTGCLTVRLRGQRSGTFGAFGLPGSSEVTTSNSCLHFEHAMVRVATATPTSGPPETTASYPHASHRNRECCPMSCSSSEGHGDVPPLVDVAPFLLIR